MRLTLATDARPEALAEVRDWTVSVCAPAAAHPENEGDVAAIVLAVHEAAANVVEHAYRGAGGPLRLEASWSGPTLTVRVWHRGEPIDREAVAAPVFDGSRERGLGTFLIEQAADRVAYETAGDEHCVSIEKSFVTEPLKKEVAMSTNPTTQSSAHVFEPEIEVLDQTTVKEFRRELAEHVAPGRQLVLDLGKVQFVDSSGLGAILSASRQLLETGGDLKICSLTPPVRVLFELVRMHRVFDVLNDREEALGAFAQA